MSFDDSMALSVLWTAAGIVVSIALFILLRDLVLWYFRINERTANQRRIIQLLEQIAGEDTRK